MGTVRRPPSPQELRKRLGELLGRIQPLHHAPAFGQAQTYSGRAGCPAPLQLPAVLPLGSLGDTGASGGSEELGLYTGAG